MNNYIIKDWSLKEKNILSTELEYKDAKELYEVFILTCYKKGNAVNAEDFVQFLLEQGIYAELLILHKYDLCCQELEDELAEEIQNLN